MESHNFSAQHKNLLPYPTYLQHSYLHLPAYIFLYLL